MDNLDVRPYFLFGKEEFKKQFYLILALFSLKTCRKRTLALANHKKEGFDLHACRSSCWHFCKYFGLFQ